MNHGSFQNLKILSAEKTLHFTKSLDMKDQADQILRKSELFESFQMNFQWTKGQVGQVGPSWAKFRLIFHQSTGHERPTRSSPSEV